MANNDSRTQGLLLVVGVGVGLGVGVAVMVGLAGCGGNRVGANTNDDAGMMTGSGGTTALVKDAPVPITIGGMLPTTGDNANSDWIAAVELAMADMNKAIPRSGWAKPVKFSIEKRDTASNEAKAYAAQIEFAALGAKAVIAEASGTAIGANKANYADQSTTGVPAAGAPVTRVPVISFTATSSALNQATTTDADPIRQMAQVDPDNWFFRTCQISDNLSPLRFAYAFAKGPNKDGDVNGDGKVKIVWIGTTAASTVSGIKGDRTAFMAAATNPQSYASEAVTFDPGADPTTFNYGTVIGTAVNDMNDEMAPPTMDGVPDMLYNKALPNVAIPFIKAYKLGKYGIPVMQDGSFRRNTILISLGTQADGQVGVSNIGYESNDSGKVFAMEQQAKTGFPPAAYEAQAYDAMTMAMLGVVKAAVTAGDSSAVTPAQVRQAMTELNRKEAGAVVVRTGPIEFQKGIDAIVAGMPIDYDGASGNVDFDGVGNVRSRAVIWEIQNGQFVETSRFDCVTDPSCPRVE